jgi:cytochrome oxidase Cu insertion factor (SCO1/SenC/PrrC family)
MNPLNGGAAARPRNFKLLFCATAYALLCAAPCDLATAQQQRQQQTTQRQPVRTAAPRAPGSVQSAPPNAAQTAAQKYFTDVELVDQDGRRVRLYSDLLKGKTVVINAFFATCKGVCPPMSGNLRHVQQAFRERVGKDLYIISITVDPETDTHRAQGIRNKVRRGSGPLLRDRQEGAR